MICQEIASNVIALKDNNVWMYLIKGRDKAVLLDTGFGDDSLQETLAGLYDGPIQLCHTHGHFDHVGGDSGFAEIYASEEEWPEIKRHVKLAESRLKRLQHGDRIDLGDRWLEVIRTPGHTPGSLSFLDQSGRILFFGDNISDRTIFMCFDGVDFQAYIQSLRWMIAHSDLYDIVLGFHGEPKQKIERAEKLIRCIELYNSGDICAEPAQIFTGEMVKKISYEEISIYVP